MVVKGEVPNLLGRDWLSKLTLNWKEIFPTPVVVNSIKVDTYDSRVKKIIEKYPKVFTEEVGCLKDFKVCIPVSAETEPKMFRARPVPYTLRSRVEAELDKLEAQGVWKRVEYSKWAAPIVPVLKDPRDPSSPVRICGDYKMTVNQVAPCDSYPIPNIEDQLATFEGGGGHLPSWT